MKNAKFPVKFVAEAILPGLNGKNRCDCPMCGGKNSLSISPDKNLFHCFKCDEAGDAVSLYAKVNKISYKSAYKSVAKLCNGITDEVAQTYVQKPDHAYADTILKRDSVYRNLLNQLSLSEKHKDNLIKRGLTIEDITQLGYKTLSLRGVSYEERDKIARESVKGYKPDSEAIGIPGFYDLSTDVPKISIPAEGILIPVRTHTMKISGFQIRYNDLPENATKEMEASFHRYGWFTSGGKKTGCLFSGCENIHHAGNWYRINFPKVIGLTEGALKADVAAKLYDKIKPEEEHLFLGLTGVSNTSQLEEELTYLGKLGAQEIHIFVDMDYRDKPTVAKALQKIKKIISSVKYKEYVGEKVAYKPMRFVVIEWDDHFKGIDDYLLSYINSRKQMITCFNGNVDVIHANNL